MAIESVPLSFVFCSLLVQYLHQLFPISVGQLVWIQGMKQFFTQKSRISWIFSSQGREHTRKILRVKKGREEATAHDELE